MKNLLITGASQGIGRATAIEAAKQGMFIGVNYNQNEIAADETLSEIKKNGGKGIKLQCNVGNYKSVENMFNIFLNEAGSLDGVFNNAGTTGPVSKIQDLKPNALEELVKTNVIGAYYVAQNSAKIMIKQRKGNIVNMTSIAADIGGAGELIHYAMTKGAIHSLTYGMAKELGEYGIRVNAVSPGLIDTEIHAKAGDAKRVQKLMPSVPLSRVGSAKEVADTVLWLLSSKSSYVCGTIVKISGGR